MLQSRDEEDPSGPKVLYLELLALEVKAYQKRRPSLQIEPSQRPLTQICCMVFKSSISFQGGITPGGC